MGYKTKVDWCDSSWNPVTGCNHNCLYCYARRIAQRFGAHFTYFPRRIHIRETPMKLNDRVQPYPYDFEPTLHRYKLDEPKCWKKHKKIFVCSMADLFGDWVPDEWIMEVMDSCNSSPWHDYLFLTKNPKRYIDLAHKGILPVGNKAFWFGTSVTHADDPFFFHEYCNTFVSIEPILEPFGAFGNRNALSLPNWIIIGAETGNRKGKVIPEKAWIDELVSQADEFDIPVFMKESLRNLMGADFRQEFPWEAKV